MTIPNILSVIRLILIPIFGYAYLGQNNSILAAAILIVSGLTDVLDGYIARKFHMQTYLGMILDPAADKLTQAVVGLCVLIKYPQILFLIVIFFAKEILTAVGALRIMKMGKKIRGSKMFGKIATFVFYVVMALLVIVPKISDVAVYVMAATCTLLFVIAFIGYLRIYMEILKEK